MIRFILYSDKFKVLNTKWQARLKILSQNQTDLWTHVETIKQTIEKNLHEYKCLAGRILTLLREQGTTTVTIVSILAAISMNISIIALAITGFFGEGGGSAASGWSPPKDKLSLKKW